MKKTYLITGAIILSIAISAIATQAINFTATPEEAKALFSQESMPTNEELGGARANLCHENVAAFATTTSATQNKRIAVNSQDRCNYILVNDSDTKVYIYRGYLGTETDASTTQIQNIGLPINANGGSYNMESDGLFSGQIWLGTTTAGKELRISELK